MKKFQMVRNMSTTNMHLFNAKGVIHKYDRYGFVSSVYELVCVCVCVHVYAYTCVCVCKYLEHIRVEQIVLLKIHASIVPTVIIIFTDFQK